jgi:predicted TIM-barrel enzyme
MGVDGTLPDPEVKKCATPTIIFADGKLKFSCETEGVEYVSEVTVADAKKNYSSEVSLTGVYKVSVYATKDGYENSDVATAEFTMSGGGMKGDVNTDGTVNALDIQEVINIASEVE